MPVDLTITAILTLDRCAIIINYHTGRIAFNPGMETLKDQGRRSY